jgi:hypothetical protein
LSENNILGNFGFLNDIFCMLVLSIKKSLVMEAVVVVAAAAVVVVCPFTPQTGIVPWRQ